MYYLHVFLSHSVLVLVNNFNMFTLYSISVAYLENVVNICIINDLTSTRNQPANNQNVNLY